MAEDSKLQIRLMNYGRLALALKERGILTNAQARELLGDDLSSLDVRKLFLELVRAGKAVALGSTKDRRYRWAPHLPDRKGGATKAAKGPVQGTGRRPRGSGKAGVARPLPFGKRA